MTVELLEELRQPQPPAPRVDKRSGKGKGVPATTRDQFTWGRREFLLGGEAQGFSRVTGTVGSGKSHVLKLYLREVLREIESNPHAKLVVFDPMYEFYPWLMSLGLKSKINYFLPSDVRSVALDFDEDYRDDNDALTLAHSFYPETSSAQESSFWGNTFRTIFAGVYMAVKKQMRRVDLRLVLLVLEDEELLRRVLGYDAYLVQARKLAGITGQSENQTLQNIQTTIQSRIFVMKMMAADLEAAKQEHRGKLFSLRRFIENTDADNDDRILVISKDESYKHVHDPLNGVLFERFTQLLASQENDQRRKIYIVIDEFPTLCGKSPMPGVDTMFLRLRQRGGIPLVADQGDSTVRMVYGDATSALLGQCSNYLCLRQPDDQSAEGAAMTLGTERGYEEVRNVSLSTGGNSSISINEQWFDRAIVSKGEIRNLSLASPQTGIEGWASSPHEKGKRPWKVEIPPGEVNALPKTNPRIKKYMKRSSEALRTVALEDDELEILMNDDLPLDPERLDSFLNN